MGILRPINPAIVRAVYPPVAGGMPWDAPLGGGAVAAVAFPTLTNLRGWYRGDTKTLSGADVDVWPDLSGVGNDMVAAAAGNRPLWLATGGPNSTPALQFAVGDYLRDTAFSWGATSTAHSVFAIITAENAGTTRKFYDYDSGGKRSISQFGTDDLLLNYESATSVAGTTLGSVGARLWGVSSLYGGRLKVYKGTTEEGDIAAPAAPGPTDGAMLTVCSDILGGATGMGIVAELIIMRSQITVGELASLGAYASARYGAGVL